MTKKYPLNVGKPDRNIPSSKSFNIILSDDYDYSYYQHWSRSRNGLTKATWAWILLMPEDSSSAITIYFARLNKKWHALAKYILIIMLVVNPECLPAIQTKMAATGQLWAGYRIIWDVKYFSRPKHFWHEKDGKHCHCGNKCWYLTVDYFMKWLCYTELCTTIVVISCKQHIQFPQKKIIRSLWQSCFCCLSQ